MALVGRFRRLMFQRENSNASVQPGPAFVGLVSPASVCPAGGNLVVSLTITMLGDDLLGHTPRRNPMTQNTKRARRLRDRLTAAGFCSNRPAVMVIVKACRPRPTPVKQTTIAATSLSQLSYHAGNMVPMTNRRTAPIPSCRDHPPRDAVCRYPCRRLPKRLIGTLELVTNSRWGTGCQAPLLTYMSHRL